MKQFKRILLFSALTISMIAAAKPALANDVGNGTYLDQINRLPLMLADAGGSITIVSPKDGAVLDNGAGNKLEYNIKLSPDGNHIHIYIDEQRPIIDRDVSNCPCSIALPDLSSGKHTIVMKEATASHALTGVQASVSITVK